MAEIWVSAVLYIALGMVVIGLVLAAGIPLINKLRDKNTFSQTKELLAVIDKNIREVAREGPGSKRFLSPLNVDDGSLEIDDENNVIHWSLTTKNKFAEPNIVFNEGVISMYLNETAVEDEYLINLELSYGNIADISLDTEYANNKFKGTYSVTIEHNGSYSNNLPIVSIRVA